jgi:hypothetical protein
MVYGTWAKVQGIGSKDKGLGLRPSGSGLRTSGFDPTRRPHKPGSKVQRVRRSIADNCSL